MSTYTAFDNNPVYFADPSGADAYNEGHGDEEGRRDSHSRVFMSQGRHISVTDRGGLSTESTLGDEDSSSSDSDSPQDNITVNSEGVVTNVEENEEPNRFFDQDGNELSFNDAQDADANNLKSGRYAKGDQLFFGISSIKLNDIVNGTISKFDLVLALARKKSGIPGDFANIALDSHGAADFTQTHLIWKYMSTTERGYLDVGVFRSSFISNQHYFRFGNGNTLYNLYDAGNFMWGNRAKKIGLSLNTSLNSAKVNSILTLNGFDTKADQNAIRNGFNFK